MMKLKFIFTLCLCYVTVLYQDVYPMESVKESKRKCCCCCCCLCDCFKGSRSDNTKEKILVSCGTQVDESDLTLKYETPDCIVSLYDKNDLSDFYNMSNLLNKGYVLREGSNSLENVTSIEQTSVDYTSNASYLLSILNKNDG